MIRFFLIIEKRQEKNQNGFIANFPSSFRCTSFRDDIRFQITSGILGYLSFLPDRATFGNIFSGQVVELKKVVLKRIIRFFQKYFWSL